MLTSSVCCVECKYLVPNAFYVYVHMISCKIRKLWYSSLNQSGSISFNINTDSTLTN